MATFASLSVTSRNRGGHQVLDLHSTSSVVGDTSRQRHNNNGNATTDRVARWLSQQQTLEAEGLVMLDDDDHSGYFPAGREPILIDVDDPPVRRVLGEVIMLDGPSRRHHLAGQKRKVSYHGHRDEDPGNPEPSGGALHQDMRSYLAGRPSMELPVRKRIKTSAQVQVNPAFNPAINHGGNTSSNRGPNPLGDIAVLPLIGIYSNPSSNPVAVTSSNPAATPSPVQSLVSSPTFSPPTTPALLPASPPAPATGKYKGRRRKAQKTKSALLPARAPIPTPRLDSVSEEIIDVDNVLSSEEVQIIEPIQPKGKCWFFALSAEIRDHIYRHLLVSQKPVHVKQMWTEPARSNARRSPRKRGAAPEKLFEMETDTLIDTRILRVCRQTAFEGTRILYSENKFLYMLRDPPRDPQPSTSRGSRRSQRAGGAQPLPPSPSNAIGRINFPKYCHLFRHMAVELEPNRIANEYESLMVGALQALTVGGFDGSSSSFSSTESGHGQPNSSRISLDTLTITITPVLEPAARNRKETSVADFFAQNSPALRALQCINSRSIRVNVHVDQPRDESDDSDDDDDLVNLAGDDDNNDNTNVVRRRDGNKRHLETTIDMRFCARYMDTANATHIRNPFHDDLFPDDINVPSIIKVYPDGFWQSDPHILAKRSMLGQNAEAALADLRERIMAACTDPDKAVLEGLWEDHEVAEQRRRVLRAKHQNRFDCDALLLTKKKKKSGRKKKKKRAAKGKGKEVARDSDDDGDDDSESDDDDRSTDASGSEGDDDDDESSEDGDSESSDSEGSELCFLPKKSLILSVSRVGNGGLRAYRA